MFKVGDKVRVINSEAATFGLEGFVKSVRDRYTYPYLVAFSEPERTVPYYEDELKLVTDQEFKIGDKVRVTYPQDRHFNSTGTVQGVEEKADHDYKVGFDDGRVRIYHESDLKLVKDPLITPVSGSENEAVVLVGFNRDAFDNGVIHVGCVVEDLSPYNRGKGLVTDSTDGLYFEVAFPADNYRGVDRYVRDADELSLCPIEVQEDWPGHNTETHRDTINPNHYQFPGGVEVIHISQWLTSNSAQALQYIARSSRIDGLNKGDTVEDLKKAIRFLNQEISRLEDAE